MDIPPSNLGKSKQLGDPAGMNWREVERAALAQGEHQVDMRSELAAIGGTKGASVVAPATPGADVSATFKTQVRTESGDPVTDAAVGFRIGGFEQIKAIRAVGSHSNQGFYQTTVTLNRAGEVTLGVTDCEKMTAIGVSATAVILALTGILEAAAAGAQGTRLAQSLEFVQTVGPKGAPAIAGASYLANQYQLPDICARIFDFIGQQANRNLIVTAVILDSQSRPEIIGAESPAGIVPVTPIVVGAKTTWDLEPIVVADPSSGGLSDVAVGKRDVSLTFWDHGVEDGDRVSIDLTKTTNGMMETVNVFTGTLTKVHATKQIQLRRGPNTIEVTALNEGDFSPNTASLTISNVVRGSDSQKWGLVEGAKGSFTITAP